MRFTLYIMIFIFLLILSQSNGSSNLIFQSCTEASIHDHNLRYDFCVTTLNEASCKSKPPNNLEDLGYMSIQITKSNGTNILSIISEHLKNSTYSQYERACLHDCLDLYKDSLSSLDDAMVAFKSKDLDTAVIKVSAALDDSVTCEDQFKDKDGEASSPLTKENHVYFELDVISLAFIQMIRQQHY